MPIILHKFKDHIINPDTEILILGTFHPDINTGADFFYGRKRNYLWRLLPVCFKEADLRKSDNLLRKKALMVKHKIDFVDLIASVEIETGQEKNYLDTYIDNRINNGWNDIIGLLANTSSIKAVYFTRKTFQGIPNIRNRIEVIKTHCSQKGIRFCLLETPSRFANAEKQQKWIDAIVLQNTCL